MFPTVFRMVTGPRTGSVDVCGMKESVGKIRALTLDSVDNPVLFLMSEVSWARYLALSQIQFPQL